MSTTYASRSHTFPRASPLTSNRKICLSSPALYSSLAEFHATTAQTSPCLGAPAVGFTLSFMSVGRAARGRAVARSPPRTPAAARAELVPTSR
eukprot:30263-Pelagococcus_subviridis.AAC.3